MPIAFTRNRANGQMPPTRSKPKISPPKSEQRNRRWRRLALHARLALLHRRHLRVADFRRWGYPRAAKQIADGMTVNREVEVSRQRACASRNQNKRHTISGIDRQLISRANQPLKETSLSASLTRHLARSIEILSPYPPRKHLFSRIVRTGEAFSGAVL